MNQAMEIYTRLCEHYGEGERWSTRPPYEVIVGAILTQNTAWTNVERALKNFRELTPQYVESLDDAALLAAVRPAGFFNQKSAYLCAVTAWYARYGYDAERVKAQPLTRLRAELLNVKGVGCETADSILLYAFGLPTFVVDAYTRRLCRRYPLRCRDSYAAVQAYFTAHVPQDVDLYDRYHTHILSLCKQHCRKNRPSCGDCPLAVGCKRKGVEP